MWHCLRRLAATAMVALGDLIVIVCLWGRWTSQRQALEHTIPGPDWEFSLLD